MEAATTIVRDASRSGTDIIGDLRLEWTVVSDVGQVRETNEDAALVMPGKYLLADGMGGHESGELASEAALLTLAAVDPAGDQIQTRDDLVDLLAQAQTRIGEIDPTSDRRAGTTATGIVLVTNEGRPHWLVLNIGDSRTYRYQAGVLEQVTVDHSQVQEFVDAGYITREQARTDPRRNVITRALGAGMIEPHADFFSLDALPGDVMLVCSDGLTGELPDEEIAEIIESAADTEEAAEALREATLGLGAHDNVTVIVVAVHDSVSTNRVAAVDAAALDATAVDDADEGTDTAQVVRFPEVTDGADAASPDADATDSDTTDPDATGTDATGDAGGGSARVAD